MKSTTRAETSLPDPDKIIHERSRLRILVYLASSLSSTVGFTELKEGLGMTAGNLSTQISTLEEAGYIRVEKRFVGKKPNTSLMLTTEGKIALETYIADLEILMAAARKQEDILKENQH